MLSSGLTKFQFAFQKHNTKFRKSTAPIDTVKYARQKLDHKYTSILARS
jgi:hypothetical protein